MKPAVRSPQRGASTSSVIFALLVIAAGTLFWWTRDDSAQLAFDATNLVSVERHQLLDAVTASGRVEPLARVAVMSRASGIVKELLVEEGDVVKVGQVLAELDREQLEAQLVQDRADMAGAEARLAAARARLDEASVRLEDPALPYAEREAERLQQLFESGDVSERELDAAQRALDDVSFGIAQVRASLPVLAAEVANADAALLSAHAALERSQTTLREATIRCPIDGVVLVRDKEVGDGVSSILTAGGNATQLMTLGDLSTMHVEARVDEVDLGRIRVGMPARVTVDAYRGRTLSGRVERIAPAGSVDDNGIVTFEVRVSVEDPDRILQPDMTADAKLIIDQRADVLVLPQRALRRESGGQWVVDRALGEGEQARLERVEVTIGLSDGLLTEIVDGLVEGDRIAVAASTARGRPPR